ncbi:MAG: HDOD domain-containing protein [Thermodesulfobacteriota bacterium]|nr:HDOD domain-containing protein [Thermodesulfobacteriota bacterium]
MAKTNTIDVIEASIESLPLIDGPVFEIISLLEDPDSNFQQIVDKISPDVALRFLNMANSAGSGHEVRSISHAVRLLGYREMQQILVTSILIDHFTKRSEDFSFDKFQRQAQFCSAVSSVLGQILNYGKPEDLFTVAILHNIGKLIIAVYFKDEHKDIIALKKSNDISSREAEQEILGVTHAEIGELVLKKFNIPLDICDAVRFHDATDRIIPEGSNFQLELISREAASIVGNFTLPHEADPVNIMERLKWTIDPGKQMCQELLREQLRTKGYREVFPELLKHASALIYRDLRRILSER